MVKVTVCLYHQLKPAIFPTNQRVSANYWHAQ